jgi:hypothetical protein
MVGEQGLGAKLRTAVFGESWSPRESRGRGDWERAGEGDRKVIRLLIIS